MYNLILHSFKKNQGDEEDIKNQEAKIYAIASKFGGMAAGGTNGERGYNLTFVIACIRVSVFSILYCNLVVFHINKHSEFLYI